MQTVDDQPETIHLYVVRGTDSRPPLYPIVFSSLVLVTLVVFCVLTQFQPPVTHITLRVPALPLPPKTFTAKVAVIPTGVKTYSATIAHGILTITNGSVISQMLPANFRLANVATDTAVFVPAGSADGYGFATVSAHALIPGTAGNIPSYSINQVEGSSIYIRNLSAFVGGKDSYSVKFETTQDKLKAQITARNLLATRAVGLHYPCTENHIGASPNMVVSWRCQYLTYHIPVFYHVAGIRVFGKYLLVDVWFVARPGRIWVK
jgi:hypothetical protein